MSALTQREAMNALAGTAMNLRVSLKVQFQILPMLDVHA